MQKMQVFPLPKKMMMKKIAKRVLAAAMAVCMMAPMAGISVCAAADTKTTNVTYTVTETYSWTVPDDITLGNEEQTGDVSVTDCVISAGKKLSITAAGTGGAFTVAAGSQTLGYEITVNGTPFTSGGVVLEVNADAAPTNDAPASAALKFKLTGTATYAGTYTGTVTYTATVVDA